MDASSNVAASSSSTSPFRLGRALAVGALLGAWLHPAPAVGAVQDPVPGAVEGVVRSADTGAALDGVRVTLQEDEEALESTRTDGEGRFAFRDLRPATYQVDVEAPGFVDARRTVDVAAGETATLRLELERDPFDLEGLRVAAGPLQVRRETTEFGSRIGTRALEEMPLPYDPSELTRFVPGAGPDNVWGGADRRANVYALDGAPFTHPGSGGPLLELAPSWLEAVEVRGLGAGASEGGFQGGLVDLTTRSGGPELHGQVRSSVEAHPLNATNVVEGDVGRERARRTEVDAQAGGPLASERLRFFVGAQVLDEEMRALSRLPGMEERFLPERESRREVRGFGKLTWLPRSGQRVDASLAASTADVDGWGLDGYQRGEALGRLERSWSYASLGWTRHGDGGSVLEVNATHARAPERFTPPQGPDVPATRLYALGDPPTPTYHNADLSLDRRPETGTVSAHLERPFSTGSVEHRVEVGAEFSRSRWRDVRRRTGNLTWNPSRTGAFDPDRPETWGLGGGVTSLWGGEVDLHSRMGRDALYVQHYVTPHPSVTFTPGVRWNRWVGSLLPGGDPERRFRAVEDAAVEPRMGAILEAPRVDDLLLKLHWGRYGQDLIAPFFDRAEGGEVFTDQERWRYLGPNLDDPTTRFTPGQRDAMAEDFEFEEAGRLRISQTGPVADDYRQPWVEQWVAGVEKGFGDRIRIEALWVDRNNRDLVGLRDRNLADNYWRFEDVRVHVGTGNPILFGGEPLTLPAVYVPHDHLLELLRSRAAMEEDPDEPPEPPLPPGMELADTVLLGMDEDFHLENLPEARRHMRQFQLTVRAAGERWGGTASLVHTRIQGNFQSVTGYHAGSDFERAWDLGAGPWARPSEQVNFQGRLPDHSPLEAEVFLHGELPWEMRGGAFLQARRGERFTPYFQLEPQTFSFQTDDGPLDPIYLQPVQGHRIFLSERGSARYPDEFTLDLSLERDVPVPRGDWAVRVDVFNVWNASAPIRINEAGNYPSRTTPGRFGAVDQASVYQAVWERIPPRTLRLGVTARH